MLGLTVFADMTGSKGLTRRFDSGHQLSLPVRDMKIAGSVIESLGGASELPDLIVNSLSKADKITGEGACHTQCIQAWEQKSGMRLEQSKVEGDE